MYIYGSLSAAAIYNIYWVIMCVCVCVIICSPSRVCLAKQRCNIYIYICAIVCSPRRVCLAKQRCSSFVELATLPMGVVDIVLLRL